MQFRGEHQEIICTHRNSLILKALVQLEELRQLLTASPSLKDIFKPQMLEERLVGLINDFAHSAIEEGILVPRLIQDAVLDELEMNPITLDEIDAVLSAPLSATSLAYVRLSHVQETSPPQTGSEE